MRNSKQPAKILFLCSYSWVRPTANRRGSAKFIICVIDTYCVWIKMDINGSLLGASNCENGLLALPCLSVLLYGWTEFYETWYLNIFQKSVRKIQVSCKSDEKNGFSHEALRIFFINSRSNFLKIKKSSEKDLKENQNPRVTKNVTSENRNGKEKMWKIL